MPTRPRLIGLLAGHWRRSRSRRRRAASPPNRPHDRPAPGAKRSTTPSAPPAETPPAAAPTTTGAAPAPTAKRPAGRRGAAGPGPASAGKHAHGPRANPPYRRCAHALRRGEEGATGATGATGASAPTVARGGKRAPAPSALTPSLPLSLSASLDGVPGFFIENFRVPPFLLPIYQAAGSAYGIPWQVLAAINEVETDYGRDLSVSSAGAEGWMQFLPAEWAQYGVDANGNGFKDPYNPADAIFAAARYLRAAGGDTNIRAAVYSYNHSQAYVDSVMLRAAAARRHAAGAARAQSPG